MLGAATKLWAGGVEVTKAWLGGAQVFPAAVAAPVTSGSIADVLLQIDTGTVTMDGAPYFTGEGITYSLTGSPPSGLTVNSSTGVLSFDTDTLTRRLDTACTLRATNASGSADQPFDLSVGPQVGYAIPRGQIQTWTTAQRTTQFGRIADNEGGYIRLDFDWNEIETAAGPTYNWSVMDDIYARANTAGLKLVGILKQHKTYSGASFKDFPVNVNEWQTFCNVVAARYPLIEHWQVGNETNQIGFANIFDDGSLYTLRMLAPAYAGIKAANPSATVIYCGLSNRETAGGDDSEQYLIDSFGAGELIAGSVDRQFNTNTYGTYTVTNPSDGEYIITNGNADWSGATMNIPTVVGKWYRFKATKGGGTNSGLLKLEDATGTLTENYAATATIDFIFEARHTTTNIWFTTNTNVASNTTRVTGLSLWEANAGEVCDAYADHPYIDTVYPGTPLSSTASWFGWEISRRMRAATVTAGYTKPFWTTEFGGATQGTNGGSRTPMTEANQAAMLLDAWRRSCVTESWRDAIMVYSWIDRADGADLTEGWFGVNGPIADGAIAKPAVATLASIKRGDG